MRLLDQPDDLKLLGGWVSHAPSSPSAVTLFFEQTVLQGQLSHDLLQSGCLAAKLLDLIGGRRPRRITGQPLLASLEKLLRPPIIEVLDDPLAAAKLGDTVLAAKPLKHDADLVLSRKMPPRRPADILHNPCRRISNRNGFLSHRC
jgi:hypothetical protein